jgi:uncharacterized alkaline shock family protein YloU
MIIIVGGIVNISKQMEIGDVIISSDVLKTIVGIAVHSVDGVAPLEKGIVSSIKDRFGKKSITKGVNIKVENSKAKVDVNISVKYGENLMEIASKVQKEVKKAINAMTNLEVENVNVTVSEVSITTVK